MKKLYTLLFFSVCFVNAIAATKTSTGTGNWSNATLWSPAGVPANTDDVNISIGHTVTMNTAASCKSLTIRNNATLTVPTGKIITLKGLTGLVVNGSCIVHGGINFTTSGSAFMVGTSGLFTWNPDDNTSSGATLWTNGVESFAATSTITIKKWYSMTTPLGDVITGNLGNLNIDISASGKWYQNNCFQTHLIQGTLTINSGFIVLDNTGAISNTTIGGIRLNGLQAHLNFYEGTHPGTFTVNTSKINVTSGELNFCNNPGTGNCIINVSTDVTLGNSGSIKCNNTHNGNSTFNVSGNFTNSGGSYFGVYKGTGNNTLNVRGNLFNLNQSWDADFYSIVDGNGEAILNVTGNLTNNCYMDLIWNSGVSGVGNGNGTLTVGGTYIQSAGDFRGIYNLSTYNAGNVKINFHDVSYTGGIFMASYACNTSAATNSMIVSGNLNINFSSPSNVFRLNGLATLASTNCTSLLTLNIAGNLVISGNGNAEFTSSSSTGIENIYVGGNSTFSGGTNYFQRTAHASRFANSGDVTVNGGITYLAYSTEAATATIGGNFNQSGNTNFILKGDKGPAAFNVNGDFTLSSGNFYLHKNSADISSDEVTTNVYGAYNQTGGAFWFDDNANATSQNILNIYGYKFLLANNSILKCERNSSSSFPGIINFVSAGTINYNRSDNNQVLANVKQYIKPGATLQLNNDLLVSSQDVANNDNLIIEQGGTLDINSFQLKPCGNQPYSGIIVKDGGRVRLKNTAGLWNNTNTAALCSSLDYYLAPNSIVEYNGTSDQEVTGFCYGSASANNKRYGILEINMSNNSARAYLNDSAFVRTSLQLTNGQLDLNNNLLTIESGGSDAIRRMNGYVKSETYATTNNAELKWRNVTSGPHVFPFGYSSSEYIPVTVNPTSGIGNSISVSTRAVSAANNIPFAIYINNMQGNGAETSSNSVINRWWDIKANGITADITLSYRGIENTARPINPSTTFSIQSWIGSTWSTPFGSAKGVTTGIGTISASGVSVFGAMVIASSHQSLPAEAIRFTAEPKEDIVDLKWAIANGMNTDFFTIERSTDGISFEVLKKIKAEVGMKNESLYHTTDVHPLPGKSYYRLKQTNLNKTFTYSEARIVNRNQNPALQNTSVNIKSIIPNPFLQRFSITYSMETSSEVKISLVNMKGEVIHNEKLNANAGINYYDFSDQENIPAGNYIITLESGTKKISKNIIKLNT